MPQLGPDVLDILPGSDSHAGVGMPQRMEGNSLYPSSFQGRFKMPFHYVFVVGRFTLGVGENKVLI
jgi:hypothetical protein